MHGSSTSPGAHAAGLYLAELLKRRYRHRWYQPQGIVRMAGSDLHHIAIARILARHIRAHPRKGRESDDERIEPHQLESLVSYALGGVRLSHATLQLFIDAFLINKGDANRLWQIYEGTERIRLLVGPPAVPPDTAAALRPGRHRTHSVHEYHYLGTDRLPCRHETLQVIEATVDGFDRHAYAFDSDALTVEVFMGGQITEPLYRVNDDIYAVDIVLSHPLKAGELCTLKYETTFRYMTPPQPEFRRAINVVIDWLDVKVVFHPARKAKRAWWAIWESLEGNLIEKEFVELDEYYTLRRYLKDVENTVVGFIWEW